MSDFNPQYEWLGIPPHEQPADHYRLLGLARFESNPTVIANAADRQISHLRMFQTGPRGKFALELIDAVSRAKACLMIPEKKEAYDQSLRPNDITTTRPAPVAQKGIEPIIFTPEKPKKAARKKTSTSSTSTIIQVAVGGAAGLCLTAAILWYGLGMDPLGIWSSRAKSESDQVAEREQNSTNYKTGMGATFDSSQHRDFRNSARPTENTRGATSPRPTSTANTSPQRPAQNPFVNEGQPPQTASSNPPASESSPAPNATAENSSAPASNPETANAAPANEQVANISERFSEGVRALQSGKVKAAERIFRECLDEGPNQIGTLNNLAIAYALQGKISIAFQTWKRALESVQGENAQATAGVLTRNLNQLGWGVRNIKVTGIEASDVEMVAALARQFQGTSEVPDRWLAFVNPAGVVPAAISTVNVNYVCLHCDGRKTIRCPVDGCRNGKLLRYTNRDEGGGVVQTVPVNVRCSSCKGTGKVRCPSCQ